MPTRVSKRIVDSLADRMIELYCDWRTVCVEVQRAYEEFSRAPAPDRASAYATYAAALDREQSACETYAAQIRAIESLGIRAGAQVSGRG
jgi:hypothetical protein